MHARLEKHNCISAHRSCNGSDSLSLNDLSVGEDIQLDIPRVHVYKARLTHQPSDQNCAWRFVVPHIRADTKDRRISSRQRADIKARISLQLNVSCRAVEPHRFWIGGRTLPMRLKKAHYS